MLSESKSRVFFALGIGEEARAECEQLQRIAKQSISTPARWTSPVDFHITLHFVGDCENVRLHELATVGFTTSQSVAAFRLRLGGLGRFPDDGAPRVLWAGAEEDDNRTASQLASILRSELSGVNVNYPTYRPHITLGYLKPGINRRAVDRAISTAKPSSEITFLVDSLLLMQTVPQSERKSGSRRYNVVQVFPFQV